MIEDQIYRSIIVNSIEKKIHLYNQDQIRSENYVLESQYIYEFSCYFPNELINLQDY